MDWLAFVYAALGGFFMGSYPVPVKSPAVLQAQVHPIVFQAYKSLWVFVSGLLCVAVRALLRKSPTFAFSWWGVASAMAWTPSGVSTIFAVSRIGMSLAVVVACATGAVASFLFFWLVFGEDIKDPLRALMWLCFILLGMLGLVFTPRLAPHKLRGIFSTKRIESRYQQVVVELPPSEVHLAECRQKHASSGTKDRVSFSLGVLAAISTGLFSASEPPQIFLQRSHRFVYSLFYDF